MDDMKLTFKVVAKIKPRIFKIQDMEIPVFPSSADLDKEQFTHLIESTMDAMNRSGIRYLTPQQYLQGVQ